MYHPRMRGGRAPPLNAAGIPVKNSDCQQAGCKLKLSRRPRIVFRSPSTAGCACVPDRSTARHQRRPSAKANWRQARAYLHGGIWLRSWASPAVPCGRPMSGDDRRTNCWFPPAPPSTYVSCHGIPASPPPPRRGYSARAGPGPALLGRAAWCSRWACRGRTPFPVTVWSRLFAALSRPRKRRRVRWAIPTRAANRTCANRLRPISRVGARRGMFARAKS